MLNRSLNFPAIYTCKKDSILAVVTGVIGTGSSVRYFGYTASSQWKGRHDIPIEHQLPATWAANGTCVYSAAPVFGRQATTLLTNRSIQFVPAGKKWYDSLDADGQAILSLFISQGMTSDSSPVVSYLTYKLNLQGPQLAETYNYAKGIK
jgi:hypothetical protein